VDGTLEGGDWKGFEQFKKGGERKKDDRGAPEDCLLN